MLEKPCSNFDVLLIGEVHNVSLDILPVPAEDVLPPVPLAQPPLACSLEIVGMSRAFLFVEVGVGDPSIDGANHCLVLGVLGMREVPRQAHTRDHGLD